MQIISFPVPTAKNWNQFVFRKKSLEWTRHKYDDCKTKQKHCTGGGKGCWFPLEALLLLILSSSSSSSSSSSKNLPGASISASLFVCLFIWLFACLFGCLLVYLFVCWFIYLFVCWFICYYLSLFHTRRSIGECISLELFYSVCLLVSLSSSSSHELWLQGPIILALKNHWHLDCVQICVAT